MADSVKQLLASWSKAIMILDASELLLADAVSRDLEHIAGKYVRLVDAERATRRLMRRVVEIRTLAIKEAFRLVLRRTGTKEIKGHSMAIWAQVFLKRDLAGIECAIRAGLAGGLNNLEISAKVVGHAAMNGVDGATEGIRHSIASLAKQHIRGK